MRCNIARTDIYGHSATGSDHNSCGRKFQWRAAAHGRRDLVNLSARSACRRPRSPHRRRRRNRSGCQADTYVLWGETYAQVRELTAHVGAVAAKHGRRAPRFIRLGREPTYSENRSLNRSSLNRSCSNRPVARARSPYRCRNDRRGLQLLPGSRH
jgi:hypothetical protein